MLKLISLTLNISIFEVFTCLLGLFQIKKVDDGIASTFFKKAEQVRGRVVELVGNILGSKGFVEITGQENDNGVDVIFTGMVIGRPMYFAIYESPDKIQGKNESQTCRFRPYNFP